MGEKVLPVRNEVPIILSRVELRDTLTCLKALRVARFVTQLGRLEAAVSSKTRFFPFYAYEQFYKFLFSLIYDLFLDTREIHICR